MKKSLILTLALALVALLPIARIAKATTQNYVGVVSDTMCGKKHMMPGKSDADCVRECVQAGAKYALVVGDRIYTLDANPATLSAFAGKKVQVSGELKGTTLSVVSIHEAPSK